MVTSFAGHMRLTSMGNPSVSHYLHNLALNLENIIEYYDYYDYYFIICILHHKISTGIIFIIIFGLDLPYFVY